MVVAAPSRTRSEPSAPPPSATASRARARRAARARPPPRARGTPPRRAGRRAPRSAPEPRSSSRVGVERRPRVAASRAADVLPAPMKPTKTRAAAPPPDALPVAVHGLEHVVDVVAAELRAVGVGEHEGDHRLPHDAGGRHGARVGALAQRLGRLVRGDVDRPQRLRQRRERLHRRADDERLARRHPALQAAGVVRLAVEAARSSWKISSCACEPGAAARSKPSPNSTPLHGLDRAQRAGEAAVEALLPADVRAEARARGRTPTTSKTPPIDSFALRWTLMWSTIARLALAVQAADGVVVDAVEVLERERLVARGREDGADLHRRASAPRRRARAGTPWRARRRPRARRSRGRSRARGRCARR